MYNDQQSSEQNNRKLNRTTEQYETLGEQDKPNAYEQIKNKQGKQSNITQSRLQKLSLGVSST
jgi:hypothetical protein